MKRGMTMTLQRIDPKANTPPRRLPLGVSPGTGRDSRGGFALYGVVACVTCLRKGTMTAAEFVGGEA